MLAFNHLGTLGRLANQMFQYASLRGLASHKGYDFCIPPSRFENEWTSHQLLEVFELENLPRKNLKYLDMGHAPIVKEKHFHFDQLLFNQCPNDVSLWGFFQSEKYFKHIEDSIREDFTFRSHILDPCKEMMEDMNNCVALHVRRTDYIENKGNHHNLEIEYYEEALKYFPDEQIIVFSDDPEWCKRQEIFSDDRFMISESGDNAIDLCLMSFCTGHIIANSSFSWWGAWLAKSEKVVAPKKWFGPNNIHNETKDIYCDGWIVI